LDISAFHVVFKALICSTFSDRDAEVIANDTTAKQKEIRDIIVQ
jgi:hypothetical protein